MKTYKAVFLNLFFLSFLGCSNKSPNKYQVKNTIDNTKCYNSLLKEIDNKNLYSRILHIRDKKPRGDGDILTINPRYRLIEFKEIDSLFSSDWLNKCYSKITSKNVKGILGLRYFHSDSIVIEINKFKRRTLNEKYTAANTFEVHRIRNFKSKKKEPYFHLREDTKWIKILDKNLYYEISQFKSSY